MGTAQVGIKAVLLYTAKTYEDSSIDRGDLLVLPQRPWDGIWQNPLRCRTALRKSAPMQEKEDG